MGWSTWRNSSKRARRSARVHGSWPSAVASCPSLPGPSPRSRRPLLRSSSARASRASVTGWRKFGDVTSVPRRTRLGHGGRGGEHGHRGVPRPVRHATPADVVVGPRRVEPGAVGPLPLAPGLGPAVGGQDDETDAHPTNLTGKDTLSLWPTRRKPSGGTTTGGSTSWPDRERLTEALSPHLLRAAAAPSRASGCATSDAVAGSCRSPWPRRSGPRGRWSGSTSRHPCSSWPAIVRDGAGADGVEFVVMDVQTGELGHEPFDLAVSQLGVMFFDEPTAAFGAIRGLLAPGGRFVFACWQGVERNPWHTGTALRSFVPPPRTPPPGKSPVGPFSLGDDEYVRDLLGGAGFSEVGCTEFDITVRAPASAVGGRRVARVHGRRARASSRRRRRRSSAIWNDSSSVPVSTSTPWPSGSTRPSTADGRVQRDAAAQEAGDHRGVDGRADRGSVRA